MTYKASFKSTKKKGSVYVKSNDRNSALRKAKLNISCEPSEHMTIKMRRIK